MSIVTQGYGQPGTIVTSGYGYFSALVYVGLRKALKIILDEASLEYVNRVFDYGSTELALENVEQEKFNEAAIGLGDGRSVPESLTPEKEKVYHEIDLLLFLKGQEMHERTDEILLDIRQSLFENDMDMRRFITGEAEEGLAFTKLNDGLSFATLVYRCALFEETT